MKSFMTQWVALVAVATLVASGSAIEPKGVLPDHKQIDTSKLKSAMYPQPDLGVERQILVGCVRHRG